TRVVCPSDDDRRELCLERQENRRPFRHSSHRSHGLTQSESCAALPSVRVRPPPKVVPSTAQNPVWLWSRTRCSSAPHTRSSVRQRPSGNAIRVGLGRTISRL